jgi:hypothetical protein
MDNSINATAIRDQADEALLVDDLPDEVLEAAAASGGAARWLTRLPCTIPGAEPWTCPATFTDC